MVPDNKNNDENCNEGDVIKEIAERNNNIENEAKLLTCDQSTSNARETVKEVKEIVNNGEESSTVKNEEIKDESNATVKEEDALPGSAQAVKTVKSTNKVTNDEAEGCKKIKVNDANDKTSNYEKPKIKTYFLKNDVTVTIAQNDKSETSVKEKCTESKSSKQEKSPSNVSLQQLLPKKSSLQVTPKKPQLTEKAKEPEFDFIQKSKGLLAFKAQERAQVASSMLPHVSSVVPAVATPVSGGMLPAPPRITSPLAGGDLVARPAILPGVAPSSIYHNPGAGKLSTIIKEKKS